MLESGVVDGDLKVCHGGSQQNGPILGNGCATFLAKFTTTLNQRYVDACVKQGISNLTLNQKVYKETLTSTLKDLS